jgi:hypothetical protein
MDTVWKELCGAYGPVTLVAEWLRQINTSDSAARNRALDCLVLHTLHQLTCYEATPAVTSEICKLVAFCKQPSQESLRYLCLAADACGGAEPEVFHRTAYQRQTVSVLREYSLAIRALLRSRRKYIRLSALYVSRCLDDCPVSELIRSSHSAADLQTHSWATACIARLCHSSEEARSFLETQKDPRSPALVRPIAQCSLLNLPGTPSVSVGQIASTLQEATLAQKDPSYVREFDLDPRVWVFENALESGWDTRGALLTLLLTTACDENEAHLYAEWVLRTAFGDTRSGWPPPKRYYFDRFAETYREVAGAAPAFEVMNTRHRSALSDLCAQPLLWIRATPLWSVFGLPSSRNQLEALLGRGANEGT